MHSLYDVLLSQHARQLTPVRCAYATVLQLHRYFEDVVLENNLSALVVESLPLSPKRTAREKARIRDLARAGRRTFFFAHQADALNEIVSSIGASALAAPAILPQSDESPANEHFIVIADTRFSALLVTVRGTASDARLGGNEVIWTFEPDIVYSALEYLMARVTAENPYQAPIFEAAVRTSMPKATSLQLTVSVTTKLAHLLQEQAGREIAVNRIATAIRESLELGVILQKTVTEVGAALNVSTCALRVEGSKTEQPLTYVYSPDGSQSAGEVEELRRDLDRHCESLLRHQSVIVHDSDHDLEENSDDYPFAVAPLVFDERLMGAVQVSSDDPSRVWQENEILLLRTVADQVAVAVNHAGLFAQIQQQALTDALTGCFNRRSFELQLDKEILMAKRTHQPLSLLMLDLDRFKHLNDTAGHDAGDDALRKLGQVFREELRGVDSAARFGGDEFALILPQAFTEGAVLVAERVRARIEQIYIPEFGNLTASIGIASFPAHAATRTELFRAADDALYAAKRGGRNRVCVADRAVETLDAALSRVSPGPDAPQQTREEIVM
ncbi:MAG TPA: sensor domain-containing diguanylate cyclase [Pyrinomonadaceae bacterium]|nr:sensor domain-containing diguanylate cyclase [Pyrinomonadaceae bacterium]